MATRYSLLLSEASALAPSSRSLRWKPEYVDYSAAAVKLMKRTDVDTYSGTFGIKTIGSTKHDTIRGRGKKSLRNSMEDKFQELVSAERIMMREIELGRDYLGLKAGSKVALYSTVGKIAFRSRLQGCDPGEFVKAMANR